MAKFNRTSTRAAVSSPVKTERTPSSRTYEGAPGYARDAKSELFLLSVTSMVGESTFYEKASDRDDRFRQLVRQVALDDPVWLHNMLIWLREDANMRSAPIVGACEMVKARLDAGADQIILGAVQRGIDRLIIDGVCQRADEPGELLAYWTAAYGRAIPKPLKRGVADAVQRLYNERSLLKYDADSKGFRFGDVIDLVHPTPDPDKPWQGDLFEHALDRRHGRDEEIPERLRMLRCRAHLMAIPTEERRAIVSDGVPEAVAATLADAGITWEALAGWLQGPMDAKAWEAIIPSMGYMALLRNLRNFDEAGVGDEVAEQVAAKLVDPLQVAKSRQMPMRFLSAYRAAPSLRWAHPLDKALTASISNIPALGGRTLILVDTSSSMNAGFSKDGTLMRWDAAALFGIALAQRCKDAEVVSFSSTARYWGDPNDANTKAFPLQRGESLLRSLDRWKTGGYFLGGGTATAAAVRRHFSGHDRVVILTDEQAASGDVDAAVPARTPLVTFNLAGYQRGHASSGTGSRVAIGGLTDAGFRVLPLLEAGRSADWPWEQGAAA